MRRYRWNPFLRFPLPSLVVSLLLAVPLFVQLGEIDVRSELRVLLEGDQRNLESYEKVEQVLAGNEIVVVSMEVAEVFSKEGIDAVRRLSSALAGGAGVLDVKSITHSSRPVRKGFGFEMIPLVPTEDVTEARLAELKDWALGHPMVRDLMVSGDSQHALIMVIYQRSLQTVEKQRVLAEEIEAVLQPFREEGLSIQTLALPLVSEEVRDTLRGDVMRILPAALGLLLVVLYATFRSWSYVLLILANQIGVLLLIPGAIHLAGFSLTVFSVILLPLLTGIHLTLLAHVYSSFQRARSQGSAVECMLEEVFKPCLFATVTTAAGLCSLILSDVRQVQEFGVMGAIGLGLILFMTFGPGLAVLKLLEGGVLLQRRDRISGGEKRNTSGRWADWVARRRTVIFLLGLASLVVSVVGMCLLRTDVRAVEFLGESSPTRRALEALDRDFGGINAFQLELDSGRAGGVNTESYLRYVEELHEFAERRPEVSGVYSYSQLMAVMNQIWEGGRADAMKLPDNPILLQAYVLALQAKDVPFLTALSDKSGRTSYLIIRTRDMRADGYLELLDDVVAYAESTKPDGVSVSAAEGVHSILEADRRIVRSQVKTVGITGGVIGLVLMFLWRSPWLALLSLFSNVIPVGLAMAAAGFLGIPLNSITVMVGAVALGITVDDSVHFITHWQKERAVGSTRWDAVLAALRVKGRPIIASSAALIAVFTLFSLSSFPPVVGFGLLCAMGIAGALVSVLGLLPAFLGGRDSNIFSK